MNPVFLDEEKVRRSRERLGYTLQLMSEEGGIAPHTIIRAEHGRNITPTSARKIAAALGVSVADLVREPD